MGCDPEMLMGWTENFDALASAAAVPTSTFPHSKTISCATVFYILFDNKVILKITCRTATCHNAKEVPEKVPIFLGAHTLLIIICTTIKHKFLKAVENVMSNRDTTLGEAMRK